MSWRVVLTNTAERQLRQLPKQELKRISLVLDSFTINPLTGDLVKLRGFDNHWRRRVGNYRIRFQLSFKEPVVFVYDVQRRTSNTY